MIPQGKGGDLGLRLLPWRCGYLKGGRFLPVVAVGVDDGVEDPEQLRRKERQCLGRERSGTRKTKAVPLP